MLKLLAIALLLSSLVQASSSDEDIESFLKESFSRNPKIVSLKVKIEQRIPIESLKGWEALMISLQAKVKENSKSRTINQKMIWFTDGDVITKELIDIDTGLSLKELVTPSFQEEDYKKENLIYGDANAKHKVVIFSDPLCPFCRKFVPKAIETMKKQPKKFAIYYYHFPLPSLHPAAVELVKAAVAAELQGRKDVVLNLYKVKINSREKSVEKILAAFNKTMKTNITPADLKSKAVLEHIKSDLDLAEKLMVNGTPTMFFDGKIDKSKRKFEKVK